jgi:arylsulfatase A
VKRRHFLKTSAAALAATGTGRAAPANAQPPNIVIVFCDDLGYGDAGCYGSRIRTPNINRMARDGALFRQFCAASPVCSPSRAALLTGRYGVRTGVPTVLTPEDPYGLADSEVTIAQMLKPAGYKTKCIGKWHLGSAPPYLPTNRGFDEYFGIPYSNDQSPSILMENTAIIETPVNLATLTQRYTEQAVDSIRRSKEAPFFLYLPHTFPHIPLAASSTFRGKSAMGLYGDVIEELDWSVGQILQEIASNGLDANTLVMFSSDNGPWFQGSPGRLRGRKGDTFEGGLRVPFIARYPGRIPPGQVLRSFASGLDILPTVARLTSVPLPRNPLDGVDIWPVLSGETDSVNRPPFLYLDNWNLQCARQGRWKLHFARYNSPAFTPEPKGGRFNFRLLNPELYDLDRDSEESADVSADHPAIVTTMLESVHELLPSFPAQVQAAWRETQSRPVLPNTAGAWPVPSEH